MMRRAFLTSLPAFVLLGEQAKGAQEVPPRVAAIFVGASWCPSCAQVAPLLARLPQDARVPVLVASLDNRPIAPFGEFIDARGHPIAQRITRIPTVLIYNHALDNITHAVTEYRAPRHFVRLLATALQQAAAL